MELYFALIFAGSVLVLLYVGVFTKFLRFCCFARKPESKDVVIGFYHPYCDAGGGGERVLWCALQALASSSARGHGVKVVIYTGDIGRTSQDILGRAAQLFGINIADTLSVEFVYVTTRHWLEASRYPRLTLLGQSLGSMVVAWDALRQCVPDIWVDTTGAAFTFPVARLAGVSHISCYVHYPMVSSDMLARVQERRPDYNHDGAIAGSATLTAGKVAYYKAVAALYGWAGRMAHVVMVNSHWTQRHIAQLWGLSTADPVDVMGEPPALARSTNGAGVRNRHTSKGKYEEGSVAGWLFGRTSIPDPSCYSSSQAAVVFPPCNTDVLKSLPLGNRKPVVLSVGQFRPEKDHALQLRAFAAFVARRKAWVESKSTSEGEDDQTMQSSTVLDSSASPRLLLIGGARDDGDNARVSALKELAVKLGLSVGPQGDVDFLVNLPLQELRTQLGSALAGLHTMWNEHFGIGVVEMMAAGVITIAHESGGPQSDIVVPWRGARTGYLATTPSQYADALWEVYQAYMEKGAEEQGTQVGQGEQGTGTKLGKIAVAARESTGRFSDAEFRTAFLANMAGLLRAAAASKEAHA